MKKRLDFLEQYEVYGFEENIKSCQKLFSQFVQVILLLQGFCAQWIACFQKNLKVGKGAQVENLPFFSLVFLRKRRRWAFLKTRFRPWIHQPSESFGLTLATETTFNSNFCSKTARYRLFLAVVRCCVTTTLAAETFGLLNVYLNYKFGLGLPSSYLFFSLFKNEKLDQDFATLA